jgi:hypothetical protein
MEEHEDQGNQNSPTRMDQEIQQQEMMRLFKQTTTEPISEFILQTPQYKKTKTHKQTHPTVDDELVQRKSPRLKGKINNGKTVVKLAQDLIAKKCGISNTEELLDNMTLQQYFLAIIKLTEVAGGKKLKKMKKKKGKKADKKVKEAEISVKKRADMEAKHAETRARKKRPTRQKRLRTRS